MAGLTAANDIAAALQTQAFSELQEGIFYNNEVFSKFPIVDSLGGSTFPYKHHSAAGGGTTTYVEGQALGEAATETYTTSNWNFTYYKRVFQVTGHARDQLKNGASSAAFFNQIALDAEYAVKEAVDLASTDMLGTGTTGPYGVQGIVDSANTVAGINQSTATWFASYEVDTAGSGLALSDLDIVWENVHDVEYAAQIDTILTSWTQIRTAKGLGLNFGSSNPFGLNRDTGNVDLGLGWSGLSYAGVPIQAVRDLTSTVWLFLSKAQARWQIVRQREWRVEPLAKTDDSDKYFLSGAWALTCGNPRHNGKLTGA